MFSEHRSVRIDLAAMDPLYVLFIYQTQDNQQ